MDGGTHRPLICTVVYLRLRRYMKLNESKVYSTSTGMVVLVVAVVVVLLLLLLSLIDPGLR